MTARSTRAAAFSGVLEVVHGVAVGREPAQELEREEGTERQVDRADPGRVGDEGGGEEVGDGGEVERQQARLERDGGRAVAVEQAPQLRTEPAHRVRRSEHRLNDRPIPAPRAARRSGHPALAGLSRTACPMPPAAPVARTVRRDPAISLPFPRPSVWWGEHRSTGGREEPASEARPGARTPFDLGRGGGNSGATAAHS